MVKIDRLPSGSYRARVSLGDGKYKTFTGKNKKDVQLQAAEFEAEREREIVPEEPNANLTVAEAMDKYCESIKNVTSPGTYREYKRKSRECLKSIHEVKLSELTQEDVQIAINIEGEDLAGKTVRDIHGYLSATLKQYWPRMALYTKLPQKHPSKISIPPECVVSQLLEKTKNTVLEIPVLLAACGGMRKSEILGLKWSDVDLDKKTIRISEAKVIDIENNLVSKKTKNYTSTRTIRMLPQIHDALNRNKDDAQDKYVTNLTSASLYHRYENVMMKICPDEHYRFHDLRHNAVSVMLSLNIPKKYIADYVGHKSENMIDAVYGHIMAEKKTEVEDVLFEYYNKLEKSVTKSVTRK